MISNQQIINTPVSSNCFVLYDKEKGRECLIVDPGSESEDILFSFLYEQGLTPKFIILTHEHFDHCWGVNAIRNRYPEVKLVCSRICSDAIQSKKRNYSVFHQQPGFEIRPADVVLDDIDWQLVWDDEGIKFYPAQGHSAAGVIFFIANYVFTGDSLIKNIKTVTKLKTASKEKLRETIELLEEEKGKGFIVCPGHGEMFDLDHYALETAL